MPAINETILRESLKSGELDKLYFMYGDDGYMKNYYCNSIANAAAPVMPEFNLLTYDYKTVDFDDLFNAIETLPVFARTKCVVINDFDAENSKSGQTEKFINMLSDTPDKTVIIICLKHITPNFKKSAKWKSFLKTAEQYGSSINIMPRTTAQLNKMIIKYAGDRGCRIERNNAAYLIEFCLGDLQTILSELDKLCAFAKETEITRVMIDKLAVKSLSASIYDLSRAVTSKNYERSFSILNALFSQKQEPVIILAQLSSAFTDIYRVKCALEGNASAESIAQDYNYRGREFLLKNAQKDAARLDMTVLRRCLDILADADTSLKGSRSDPQIIIEQTVAELIVTIKTV